MKIKAKEFLIELLKEEKRNEANDFFRIFPTQLMTKYEIFLEKSVNYQIYKQVYSILYSN